MEDLKYLAEIGKQHHDAVHVSVRFSGEEAKIWKDLREQFPNKNTSELIKECIVIRALLLELQRRKLSGEKAEVTFLAKETDYKPEDFLTFIDS